MPFAKCGQESVLNQLFGVLQLAAEPQAKAVDLIALLGKKKRNRGSRLLVRRGGRNRFMFGALGDQAEYACLLRVKSKERVSPRSVYDMARAAICALDSEDSLERPG